MYRCAIAFLTSWLLVASAAQAQPTLDSLWPNPDGMRWEYDYHFVQIFEEPIDYTSPAFLELDGTVATPGGTAQVLLGEHNGLPGKSAPEPNLPYPALIVWRGRPDLREAIVARYGGGEAQRSWFPYFLHPGYFLKTPLDIEMWQADFDHLTWIYLEDDLDVGSSFTLQLMPEFDDNIFLHGTVGAIDATVTTPAGTYTNAVRMDYLVDFGWRKAINDEGEVIGTFHSEHAGRVYYVPEIGPVDLYEESIPFAEVECPACPDYMHEYEGVATQTQSLTLTSTPMGSQAVSWSSLKAGYR